MRWWGLALHYLALFFVGLALNWAASRISDGLRGSRTALLAPLLIGLLAPQPGLLLALAGGLLATAGRDERLGQRPHRPVPRVWWAAGAALGGVLLLSVMLPRQAMDWAALGGPTPPPAVQGPSSAPQPAAADPTQTPSAPATPGMELPFQFSLGNVALPTDAILLGGLLLLLAGGGLMWRLRRRETGKPRLIELLMVAGLLLTGALWLAAGVLLSGSGGGSSGAGAQAGSGAGNALAGLLSNITGRRQIDISAFVQGLLWLSLVALFALAALLVWMNVMQAREGEEKVEAPLALKGGPSPSAQPALHRVRLAYRQAEEALRQHGRGRRAAETPAGYAARLSGFDPALAGPLDTLTRAYAPVRYGGRVTDEDAEGAEAAARELARALPALPPPHDPDDDSTSDHEDNP
ncbi:hypothetical protein GCM10010840_21370 [Deinococcus aerolatus]|uniref:Protein-glutamine gamma-glutamyltransferase-like C-terminal domain-containing protein n=1 Tax=Deinococcus aerolatus TaxID=522487 RepID=A0ABQ2GB23_9DEIO|nr:DUF4129 domain-containing protein [Deinococcus aerolatus]GGL83340.1 hypothetical protein GCM10010840_21370 [Deinococcus aerolatus]